MGQLRINTIGSDDSVSFHLRGADCQDRRVVGGSCLEAEADHVTPISTGDCHLIVDRRRNEGAYYQVAIATRDPGGVCHSQDQAAPCAPTGGGGDGGNDGGQDPPPAGHAGRKSCDNFFNLGWGGTFEGNLQGAMANERVGCFDASGGDHVARFEVEVEFDF